MGEPTPEFRGAEVVDVIDQVKQAFAIVSREAGADLIPLKSVELTLTAATTYTIDAGVKFKIPFLEWEVEIGHKVSEEYTHVIELSLEPPAADSRLDLGGEPISRQLVDALRTIRNVASKATQGDIPLALSEGSVDLQFVVTQESVAKVLVVSGERKSVTTHQLKVLVGATDEA
jgi:hypothetical protein